MIALVIAVEQGTVRPATAVVPAAMIAAGGVLLLTGHGGRCWRPVAAGVGAAGWSVGRLWRLSLISWA